MGNKKEYWSGEVTKHSIALDLEKGVLTWDDPKKIAASLKHSVDVSTRRKAKPFQSTISMINFYINRAGKNLPSERRKVFFRHLSGATRSLPQSRLCFGLST